MRLSGVSDNLAIPMPEDSGTASSLVARPNSPRLREGRAFGVKIFQFAEIQRHGLYRLTGYVFSVASNPEGCQKLAGGFRHSSFGFGDGRWTTKSVLDGLTLVR